MIKHNQDGGVGAVVSIVLLSVFLVSALGFGVWAFMGRSDYKNNVDEKIAAAVAVAKKEEATAKDKQFAEDEKNPLKAYTGPQAYGSIQMMYPKTWSGLVDDTGKGNALVDGYFSPGVVPSIEDTNSSFALRFQVTSQTYAQSLQTVKSLQEDSSHPAKVTPYALPLLPKIVGVHVSGALPGEKTGEMIVLPLRSQTLMIWTEGNTYSKDFNKIILSNFKFSP